MNGCNKFHCRRHTDARVYCLGLLAAIALASVLLQPAQLYPDQHREQVASRQGRPEQVIEMECTAYTSTDTDCGKHDGITATGTKAGPGTVAADWNRYPPGTRLEVPGYGRGVVADRGGGITGDRLDLWMHDQAAAREWGRRKVEVRVLE